MQQGIFLTQALSLQPVERTAPAPIRVVKEELSFLVVVLLWELARGKGLPVQAVLSNRKLFPARDNLLFCTQVFI